MESLHANARCTFRYELEDSDQIWNGHTTHHLPPANRRSQDTSAQTETLSALQSRLTPLVNRSYPPPSPGRGLRTENMNRGTADMAVGDDAQTLLLSPFSHPHCRQSVSACLRELSRKSQPYRSQVVFPEFARSKHPLDALAGASQAHRLMTSISARIGGSITSFAAPLDGSCC